MFRDSTEREFIYEPIASIEFRGTVSPSGESFGHYICYVKENVHKQWYFTNDNDEPIEVDEQDISKLSYVTLFHRKDWS